MRHVHIHVTGIVQGVGMRPFVYREAMAHGICGWVLNAGRGRRVLRQRGDKAVECLDRSMRLDVHAIARIEHPAANAMRHSLAIHKWPHANALHNARYMDMHMSHATLLR